MDDAAAKDGASARGGSTATNGTGGTGGTTQGGGQSGGEDVTTIFPDLDASAAGSGGTSSAGGTDAGSNMGGSADASTVASSCFGGGSKVTFTGDGVGTCDNPLRVDLSAGNPDDVSFLTLPSTMLDETLPDTGKCGAGAMRDFVLLVWVPAGADLEVSVDGVKNRDPLVIVIDPPTADCATGTASQCVDRGGVGDCEYLRINAPAANDPGYRQLVISELESTSTRYTLRLRLLAPGGGA